MKKFRIAIVGAGTIGRTHIEAAMKNPAVELVGVAEPYEEGKAWVLANQIPWFASHGDLMDKAKPME